MLDWIKTNAESITAIGTAIAGLAALAAVLVAWFQLKNLVDALTVSAVGILLSIEAQMTERKTLLSSALADYVRSDNGRTSQLEKEKLKSKADTCCEDYLNAVDRFAFCVLAGHFKGIDLKKEYREYIANCVKTWPEHFQEATDFKNIRELHRSWEK